MGYGNGRIEMETWEWENKYREMNEGLHAWE